MKRFAKIADTNILGSTANAIRIGCVTVTPYQSANIEYSVLNMSESLHPADSHEAQVICTGSILISGSDYEVWGPSDDYLYSQLCSRLQLTILPD
jgi:hypothetical protein